MIEPVETLLTTPHKLQYLLEILKPVFSKIIVAVIVLLIGLILGKIIGNIMQKGLYELQLNRGVRKLTGLRLRLEEFIGYVVQYGIFFIAIVFALDILQLSNIIVQSLGLLILITIGISFILSIKEFLPNLFSGLIIAQKKLIQENDMVEIDGIKGKVLQVELLETKVLTPQDDVIYIPNSIITNKKIKRSKR